MRISIPYLFARYGRSDRESLSVSPSGESAMIRAFATIRPSRSRLGSNRRHLFSLLAPRRARPARTELNIGIYNLSAEINISLYIDRDSAFARDIETYPRRDRNKKRATNGIFSRLVFSRLISRRLSRRFIGPGSCVASIEELYLPAPTPLLPVALVKVSREVPA